MATGAALDVSPISFVRALRGTIVGAQLAYPEVLHVEVRDAGGHSWRLATQDASWSPHDPIQLIGCSIEHVRRDERTGKLGCRLSDGSVLKIEPAPTTAEDDPPNWELISPTGLVLEFGPGVRWQFVSIDARASSRS